jgi:hypothetical protein
VAVVKPEILVYAEWGWTCQECFETVKGYDSEQAAKDDASKHECERYE